MDWNPHAPDVLGPEFQPKSGVTLPAYTINAQRKAAAMKIRATETEIVDHLGMFLKFPKPKQQAMIEVLDFDNAAPEVVTTTLRANAGSTVPGLPGLFGLPSGEIMTYLTISGETFDPARYIYSYALGTEACSPVNIVDDVHAAPGQTMQDYYRGIPTSATYADFTVSAHLAFPTTTDEGHHIFKDRRILDIRIHVVAAYNFYQQTAPADGGGFRNIGVPSQPQPLIVESRGFDVVYGADARSNYQMDSQTALPGTEFPLYQAQWGHYIVTSADPQEYVFSCGEMNPHPRMDDIPGGGVIPRWHPWAEFEMLLFNRSAGNFGDCPAGLWPINVYGGSAKIFQVWMEVDHCAENRVALANPNLTHLEASHRIYSRSIPGGSAEIGGHKDTQPAGWTMVRPYLPNPITGLDEHGGPPISNGGDPEPSPQPREFEKQEGRDYLFLARQPRWGTTSLRMQSDMPDSGDTNTGEGFISTGVIPGTTGSEFQVPYVEGFAAAPGALIEEYPHVGLNSWGLPEVLGEPSGNRLLGVYMGTNIRNVDGTTPFEYATGLGVISDQSVDSQPYVDVPAVLVDGQVRQGVTGASAQAYDGVLVVARYTTNDRGVVGDLVAGLYRASDDNLIATATITREDADLWPADTVAGWRRIQAPFTAPETLSAVDYYVDFTQDGLNGSWEIAALNSKVLGEVDLGSAQTVSGRQWYNFNTYSWEYDNQPYGGSPPSATDVPVWPGPNVYAVWPGVATYGGETQHATEQGAVEVCADLAVLVYAKPDEPTGVAGSPQLLIMGETGPCGAPIDCGLEGVPYVSLGWTPPVSLSNFAYYEIQRADMFDDWATVAVIADDEGARRFDIEGRLNIESFYRIRTVNVVGIASDWVTTPGVYLPSAGCGYSFSSNVYVDAAVGYPDVYDSDPTREFEFPEADERVLKPILGRDDFVAFRPAERRGDRFKRTLMVNGTQPASRPGPRVFDPLQALARDTTLPYVCVRDEDGNRWFASITVPAGSYRKPTNMHWVEVTVDVITETSAVVTEVS